MTTGKVLVIDDEQSVRRICTLYLQAEGLHVATKPDAEEIVNAVTLERPDVIVLDLNLPGTDGFTAARELKKSADTADIPVLILSGRQDLEDKQQALLTCGADDYLTKPFDPGELVTRISVLRRRRQEIERQTNIIGFLQSQIVELRNRLNHALGRVSHFDDALLDRLEDEFVEPLAELTITLHDLARENSTATGLAAGRLQEQVRQLQAMVSKLVELKRYRSGTVTPDFADVTLGALVGPLREVYQNRATRQHIDFTFVSDDPHIKTSTDAERLRRAMALLLERAFEEAPAAVSCSLHVRESRIEFVLEQHPRENAAIAHSGLHLVAAGANQPVKLPLAQNIVTMLGGSLVISAAGSRGTRLMMTVPVIVH